MALTSGIPEMAHTTKIKKDLLNKMINTMILFFAKYEILFLKK